MWQGRSGRGERCASNRGSGRGATDNATVSKSWLRFGSGRGDRLQLLQNQQDFAWTQSRFPPVAWWFTSVLPQARYAQCCRRSPNALRIHAIHCHLRHSARHVLVSIEGGGRSVPRISRGTEDKVLKVRTVRPWALLVELDRCLAEEHEIRRRHRNRPVNAEDRDLDLVPGLYGIGEHHAVGDVEALDGGRAGDAGAARHLAVD